jgi:hypothetical protein
MDAQPASKPDPAASNGFTFRPTYTCAQFVAEILQGKRSVAWVQDQCRWKRIKTVARKPWIIPGSEARRFCGEK